MAKRKTARQVAASRRNIRKAQAVSARKRLAAPNKITRRPTKTRSAAVARKRGTPIKPGQRKRNTGLRGHIGRNKIRYGTAIGLATTQTGFLNI